MLSFRGRSLLTAKNETFDVELILGVHFGLHAAHGPASLSLLSFSQSLFGLQFGGHLFEEDVSEVFVELFVLLEVLEGGLWLLRWRIVGFLRAEVQIWEAQRLLIFV